MRYNDNYTRPEHRLQIYRFFKTYPHLGALFDTLWIRALTDPLTERDSLLPIFWTLANPLSHKPLAESLGFLALQRDTTPIVRDLKRPDADSVNSLLRELEIFRGIRITNASVQWKPKIDNAGGRSPDLGLTYQDQNMFIEILTVRHSRADQQQDQALEKLTRFINQMQDHYYTITCEVHHPFDSSHLTRCTSFVKGVLRDLTRQVAESAERSFDVNGQTILSLKFQRDKRRKGLWGITLYGTREVKEAGRIKGKILDKLESFQFPKDTAELKGYAVVLEGIFSDHEALISALQGRLGMVWRGDHTTEWIRQKDGAVFDPERGRLLLDEVDFVVSLKPNGGLALKFAGALVNGERNRVTIDEIRNLFSW